jgi:protein PsiE
MQNPAPDPIDDHGLNPEARATALRGFRAIERSLLVVIAVMTLAAAAFEVQRVIMAQSVNLADILLMFLYTEVIGMIAVFYGGRESPFVYPIFIAITALARLIVLQGKAMAPENIVFEASAILLLSIAALIIARTSKS